MKIENIIINVTKKKVYHYTSEGLQEIKLQSRKDAYSEGLEYIENYATQNGFELINVYNVALGVEKYAIVKK